MKGNIKVMKKGTKKNRKEVGSMQVERTENKMWKVRRFVWE